MAGGGGKQGPPPSAGGGGEPRRTGRWLKKPTKQIWNRDLPRDVPPPPPHPSRITESELKKKTSKGKGLRKFETTKQNPTFSLSKKTNTTTCPHDAQLCSTHHHPTPLHHLPPTPPPPRPHPPSTPPSPSAPRMSEA